MNVALAWQIAQLVAKVVIAVISILESREGGDRGGSNVTETVKCASCGEEAWVIRYGAIRVGQDLTGWYAQATTDTVPVLLCRSCWHKAIGQDDYSNPVSEPLVKRP